MYVPDNYDLWKQHDAEQQAKLDKLPECSNCNQPIQERYCYEIDNELLCEDCMKDSYRVTTEDFIDY